MAWKRWPTFICLGGGTPRGHSHCLCRDPSFPFLVQSVGWGWGPALSSGQLRESAGVWDKGRTEAWLHRSARGDTVWDQVDTLGFAHCPARMWGSLGRRERKLDGPLVLRVLSSAQPHQVGELWKDQVFCQLTQWMVAARHF